jgi:SAM-dependent methyltransferase
MDRAAQLLSTTQRSSRILEIGPSHAPIAPKAAGWNSSVIDHASQAQLRAKYRAFGLNIDAIEPVDFVWTSGGLADAVPPEFHGTFDTIIASHVIEHVPDFVGFFVAARKLLKPTGTLALAVPDLRFCFDFFQSYSQAGEMMDAHLEGRVRHSRRTVFNHLAHIIIADGATAWGQHPVKEFALLIPFRETTRSLRKWSADPDTPYKDYHAWQFTPSSFQLAVLELAMLGLLDFHVVTAWPPAGSEFIVLLQPGPPPFAAPELADEARLALMRQVLLETREQVEYALGPRPAASLAGEPAARLQRIEARLREVGAAAERGTADLAKVAAMAEDSACDSLAGLADLARANAQGRARIVAMLKDLVERLDARQTVVHEIQEVAFWHRRAMQPARWAWTKARPVRRLFHRNGRE